MSFLKILITANCKIHVQCKDIFIVMIFFQEAEIRDVGKLIDKYGITEQELDRIKEEVRQQVYCDSYMFAL